jgi:hypothetical protein
LFAGTSILLLALRDCPPFSIKARTKSLVYWKMDFMGAPPGNAFSFSGWCSAIGLRESGNFADET